MGWENYGNPDQELGEKTKFLRKIQEKNPLFLRKNDIFPLLGKWFILNGIISGMFLFRV